MNHLHQQRSMLYQLAMPFVYNKYAAYVPLMSENRVRARRKSIENIRLFNGLLTLGI